MNYSTRPVLIILTLLILTFSWITYTGTKKESEYRKDLIELSQIKYGLFNVDEWKEIVSEIITIKIEEFKLDESNRPEMERKVSSLLYRAVDGLEHSYYQENSKSIFGIFKGGVAMVTNVFGQIRRDVPEFTVQILDFLNEEDNRDKIKGFLLKKLEEYSDDTFSKTDYSQIDRILTKYSSPNTEEAKSMLSNAIAKSSNFNVLGKITLIFLAILTGLILLFDQNVELEDFSLFLLISFVYLCLGLLLPMIQIDARISEMSFSLLGSEISFVDQVLYYKSKSILEVVSLMLSQSKIELISIGLLVLMFSVFFPLIKLVFALVYSKDPAKNRSDFFNFIVFKSGKWSMADVFVVAIFMSFIGFDGIISEQVKQLESISTRVDLLTTNESSLVFGFYMFLIFVILGIGISQKLQRVTKKFSS